MPVRQYNPALSEGIEAIINKCVEPAAEKRYQSCAELLVDLQSPDKVTGLAAAAKEANPYLWCGSWLGGLAGHCRSSIAF